MPEAMACGLPVIITKSTGSSEMVTPDTGIIIDAGSKQQLEEAVLFFINNKELISNMSEAAMLQS
ncbi:glycosyltransferase, partial [Vibrio parahaemolyticus]